MIKKTKFSTITAVVATIAAIAAMGSIGGGIGLGQQQMALAQVPVDSRDIGGDEGDLGDVGHAVRDVFEDDEEDDDDDGGIVPLCREPGEIFVNLAVGGYICLNINEQFVLSDIGQDFP